MTLAKNPRVAWLFPSLESGNYWHPVLAQFTQVYGQTLVYTGIWPGYAPGYEDRFPVQVVGKMKFVDMTQSKTGYGQGFISVSPSIVGYLLRFKPQVIFTSGFSLWTLLSLLLKPLGRWWVVVVYDGSSPGVDYSDSRLRTLIRQGMTRLIDAFITNSEAGQTYLTQLLKANAAKVFTRPYQVPDAATLLQRSIALPEALPHQRPMFLYVGQLIPRKGVKQLVEACRLLRTQSDRPFSIFMIGEGPQRQELETLSREYGLETCIHWVGQVSYSQLGSYFRAADVFILPTLEDIWGMVVLEAMAFGKPILCSQWAGAAELICDGENGYLFDAHQPEAIATAMQRLIDQPDQIAPMGERSAALIAKHTPTAAAQFLVQVTRTVCGDSTVYPLPPEEVLP